MLVTRIVRGNAIEFTATFLDAQGDEVIPATVNLHLSYIEQDGARGSDVLEMEGSTDGAFSVVWNSSVSKKGRVHWAVRAENPPAAEQGTFELEANLANPDPSETV